MFLKVALPEGMTCTGCILQYTYTAGNNWGKGPQSAEVQSEDCLDQTSEGKLGCGNQETFRGCADICIGNFCPTDQETCQTVDETHGGQGNSNFYPRPPAEPTRPTVAPTHHAIIPTRPSSVQTCDIAGVKPQYFR